MIAAFRRMLCDENGGPLMEYAVIFAMFSLLCALALIQVASNAGTRYTTSTNTMTSVQENPLPTASPGS